MNTRKTLAGVAATALAAGVAVLYGLLHGMAHAQFGCAALVMVYVFVVVDRQASREEERHRFDMMRATLRGDLDASTPHPE